MFFQLKVAFVNRVVKGHAMWVTPVCFVSIAREAYAPPGFLARDCTRNQACYSRGSLIHKGDRGYLPRTTLRLHRRWQESSWRMGQLRQRPAATAHRSTLSGAEISGPFFLSCLFCFFCPSFGTPFIGHLSAVLPVVCSPRYH